MYSTNCVWLSPVRRGGAIADEAKSRTTVRDHRIDKRFSCRFTRKSDDKSMENNLFLRLHGWAFEN